MGTQQKNRTAYISKHAKSILTVTQMKITEVVTICALWKSAVEQSYLIAKL